VHDSSATQPVKPSAESLDIKRTVGREPFLQCGPLFLQDASLSRNAQRTVNCRRIGKVVLSRSEANAAKQIYIGDHWEEILWWLVVGKAGALAGQSFSL